MWPTESVTVNDSVCVPSGPPVVFQLYEALAALTVCVETTVPSTESWKVLGAVAVLTAMPTLTVPPTVAPGAGLVNEAVIPVLTVTLRVAVPVWPLASVTVALSVVGPFGKVVVFQLNELLVPVKMTVPLASTR